MPRPPRGPLLSSRRGWEAREQPERLPTEGREVRRLGGSQEGGGGEGGGEVAGEQKSIELLVLKLTK